MDSARRVKGYRFFQETMVQFVLMTWRAISISLYRKRSTVTAAPAAPPAAAVVAAQNPSKQRQLPRHAGLSELREAHVQIERSNGPLFGPSIRRSPRHRMTFNSTHEGFKYDG